MLRNVKAHTGPIVETFQKRVASSLETSMLLTLRALFRALGASGEGRQRSD